MFFAIPPHPFIKAQQLFCFDYFSFMIVIQRVLYNLAKCQPFLKNNAYYVADLIPLIADSLFF